MNCKNNNNLIHSSNNVCDHFKTMSENTIDVIIMLIRIIVNNTIIKYMHTITATRMSAGYSSIQIIVTH